MWVLLASVVYIRTRWMLKLSRELCPLMPILILGLPLPKVCRVYEEFYILALRWQPAHLPTRKPYLLGI